MSDKNWWQKNFQNGGGKIDTSRVAKIAITYFLVTTIIIVSFILLVIFVQFLGQWWSAKGSSVVEYKLMLSADVITKLFALVGAIIGWNGVDYRLSEFLKGRKKE